MPNNNPHGHNQYTKSEFRSSNRSIKGESPDTDEPGTTATPGEANLGGATGAGGAASTDAAPSGTSKRGFASMDERTQREIASKGGHSQGRENNPGNFANDRDKAREAGRKGGEAHGSHR